MGSWLVRGRFMGGVIVACCAAFGCSSGLPGDGNSGDARQSASATSAGRGRQWAGEIESARQGATTDLQRKVLADGVITEQEAAALQDVNRRCLQGHGFTKIDFQAGGGVYVEPPKEILEQSEKVTSIVNTCEEDAYGPVMKLYWDMQRNPQHRDEAELMVNCMKRGGVVPSSYGVDDYNREMTQGGASFDTESDAFSACVQDPENAHRG